jgi:nucleolar protein 56
MKRLVTKWYGVVITEGGRVERTVTFPNDAAAIADRLERMRAGQVLDEERDAASTAGDVEVAERRLAPLGRHVDAPVTHAPAPDGFDLELLHEALLRLARRESRIQRGARDRFLGHAVRNMDELTRSINTLSEMLGEWYALHDPEGVRRVEDHAKLVDAVAAGGDRQAFAKAAGVQPASESLGIDLGQSQREAIASYAAALAGLIKERGRLETLVTQDVRAVAPALCSVVGDLVAARLIAHAGGLQRLAFLPASTVQTLGAENALFAHLREGKKPPKHGVLFVHPAVNTAHPKQRGRIARTLAAKACLAARTDWFAGDDAKAAGERIAKQAEAAVAEIRSRPITKKAHAPSAAARGRRSRP